MQDVPRDARAEAGSVFLGWGAAGPDNSDGYLDGPVLWLAGGAALLLWTAVSVLLTSA